MCKIEADRHLLFGLLALQTGLIHQGALFTAFNAWTRNRDRSMAEILFEQGDLNDSRRNLLEALVSEHLKIHGGDPEKSLAAIETDPSARRRLTQLTDSGLSASVALLGPKAPVNSNSDPTRAAQIAPSSDDGPPDFQQQLLAEQHRQWTCGQRVVVETILEQHRDLRDNPELLLDLIYNEIVLRENCGEAPDIDEYVRRFPELRDAIRKQFEIHRMFAEQVPACGAEDGDRSWSLAVGTPSSSGLRFRVLRPHARGGLGAVFVALDTELHREVALKQILDRHADDPTSRRRFLLEAEIAGRLEHPGIVPVYGMGTYANGRPFFAMRFIKGDSFKDVIAAFHSDKSSKHDPGRRSLELRKLLRRFVDVCNAIEYAHSRGVLHRDLKPSNIIVGKHGETLVVDWGLAKSVGRSDPATALGERTLVPSSSSGSAETLPGSALGTPAFMSPEQAAGDLDRLGPRSDVYSLGATLYVLLTGRPAFEDNDVAAVLEAVRTGDFPRPRKLDPTIDRSLEAICRMAMARSTEDRYISARTLAEDIERWMADEPVTAWREPFSRRARRWRKRNRTAMTAAAVALVAAFLGTGIVLAVQTQANTDLRMANGLLTAANVRERRSNAELTASNEREHARFELAMEAIRMFHGEVSEDLLLKEKQFERLRTKLLRGAASFYGKLESMLTGQTDTSSRAALASAYAELADLTAKIGNVPDALAVHKKALVVRRYLASVPNAEPASRLGVARSLVSAGRLANDTGDTNSALAAFEEALKLTDDAIASGLGSDEALATQAESHEGIGHVQRKTSNTPGAVRSFREALAIRSKLASANPAIARYQRELARSYSNIAGLQVGMSDPAGARSSYSQALAIQQKLADARPSDPELQAEKAASFNDLGRAHLAAGDTRLALQSYELALPIWEKLADAHPVVTSFQSGLAASHSNIGYVHGEASDTSRALNSYHRALGIRQKLADANPAVTAFQANVAINHTDLGNMLRRVGDPSAALLPYSRALEIWEKLEHIDPAVDLFVGSQAVIHNHIGFVRSLIGDMTGAIRSYRQALAIYEKLARANPTIPRYMGEVARDHDSIAYALQATGEDIEAFASYRQAFAIRQKLVNANPDFGDSQAALATSYDRIGEMQASTGDNLSALRSYRRAVAIQEKLADVSPTVTRHHADLAVSLDHIGDVLFCSGDAIEAMKAYFRALAIREELARDRPAVAYLHDYVAASFLSIGNAQRSTGRTAEALISLRRAVEILDSLVAKNPALLDYKNRLCASLTSLGDALQAKGEMTTAQVHSKRAVATMEPLVQSHPENVFYRSGLARSLVSLSATRETLGDRAKAVADLQRAIALYECLPNGSPDDLAIMAQAHARLACLVDAGRSGTTTERGAAETDKAMECLCKAVAGGYRDVAMKTDRGFDTLRERPDFQLLLLDVDFPFLPFRSVP
jgi:serine/threonine-protein kinase